MIALVFSSLSLAVMLVRFKVWVDALSVTLEAFIWLENVAWPLNLLIGAEENSFKWLSNQNNQSPVRHYLKNVLSSSNSLSHVSPRLSCVLPTHHCSSLFKEKKQRHDRMSCDALSSQTMEAEFPKIFYSL